MANVARFLKPDPPAEDRHILDLFVDRERESEQAQAQVAAVREDDLGLTSVLRGQVEPGS